MSQHHHLQPDDTSFVGDIKLYMETAAGTTELLTVARVYKYSPAHMQTAKSKSPYICQFVGTVSWSHSRFYNICRQVQTLTGETIC